MSACSRSSRSRNPDPRSKTAPAEAEANVLKNVWPRFIFTVETTSRLDGGRNIGDEFLDILALGQTLVREECRFAEPHGLLAAAEEAVRDQSVADRPECANHLAQRIDAAIDRFQPVFAVLLRHERIDKLARRLGDAELVVAAYEECRFSSWDFHCEDYHKSGLKMSNRHLTKKTESSR